MAFLIERLARALPAIVAAVPEEAARARLAERLGRILYAADGSIAPEGVYALVDYVNFKGEGTQASGALPGRGLGPVAGARGDGGSTRARSSPPSPTPRPRCSSRRVALAPGERREARWLDGWLKRVASYADDRRFEAEAASDPPAEQESS